MPDFKTMFERQPDLFTKTRIGRPGGFDSGPQPGLRSGPGGLAAGAGNTELDEKLRLAVKLRDVASSMRRRPRESGRIVVGDSRRRTHGN